MLSHKNELIHKGENNTMSKKSIKCLKFLDNISSNTARGYHQTIKKYEEYHDTSIEELVLEALDEQSNQVPQHMLSIINRIEDFQTYLIEQGLVYSTIKLHIARIKSLYHKNRIVIPYIEPLNPKQIKRRPYIEYKDVLTKDELKQALTHMLPPVEARAMTMIQGGLSNEECEHLTTRNFIDETYKYHQCDNDVDALRWLANPYNPIIWVTRMIRIKTGKPYYVVIGAESVNSIAFAKLYEMELPKNKGIIPEKLLNTNKGAFGRSCRNINNKCGFGKVAEESKFKPHNLRRFHATNIKGSVLTYEENSRISNSEIDELQGRGKTNVQDTYIKSNPLQQKLLYAKVMNNVSLYHEYDYTIVGDDVIISIRDPTEENKRLKEENKKLRKENQKKKESSEKVKRIRNEMGEEAFNEMILGILSGGE